MAMAHTATIAGLKMAINIVKRHEAESEVQEKIHQQADNANGGIDNPASE